MIKTTTLIKKITIQKCKLDDSDMILKIFNESVRKGYTGTRMKIKSFSHEKWLKEKLLSKKDVIFIAKLNNILISYVRFDNIYLGNCNISIAIKNQFINKGYGSKILKKSIAKLIKLKKIKTIMSKVKKKNVNSIKFFLKNNFIEIPENKIDKENYRYFKLNIR